MHNYLKANTRAILEPDVVQLVNDRKLSREVAADPPPLPAQSSSSSTSLDDKPAFQNDPILQARMMSPSGSSVGRPGMTKNDRYYIDNADVPLTSSQAEDAIMKIRSALSDADESRHSWKLKKHRMMPALTDSLSSSCDADEKKEVVDNDDGGSSAALIAAGDGGEVTGLEVTLGQFKSRIDGSNVPSNSLPWESVKLKPSVESLTSANSTTELSSPADSHLLPEWANMKLRPTKRGDSETSSISELEEIRRSQGGDSESDVSEMGKIRRDLSTKSHVLDALKIDQTNTTITASSISSNAKSLSLDPLSSSEELDTIAIASSTKDEDINVAGSSTTDKKDGTVNTLKNSDSSQRGKKIDNDAVIVRLINVSGTTKAELARVVIGTETLMVVKSTFTDPKAQVLWKIRRTKIDSMALDMATLTVKLVLIGQEGRKDLSFATSEDCLRFANAFYADGRQETGGSATEPHSVQIADDSDVGIGNSFHTESLNEEEQKVLETYRRLRKTTASKAALQASLPVVMPSLQDHSASLLSSEEEEIACLYRNMLKVGSSFDDIESKMKEDNVDEKMIAYLSSEVNGPIPNKLPRFVAAETNPSSPVSAMSSIGLSVAEAELAEEYKKMLRLKIEPDAVRHKMEKDHVLPKIMAAVLGEGSDEVSTFSKQDESTDVQLSEEEEQVAESFRKMLKLRFPEEVVRHRMKKEQVSARIVDAIFGKRCSAAGQKTDSTLSPLEAELANKYRKMLKMGIQQDAVRHKMTRDQVEQKIIDVVVGAEGANNMDGPATTEKRNSTSAVALKRKSTLPSLSHEEESVASIYRRMLKLQVPKESVLRRMQQEGVSEKIISAVIGSSSAGSSSKMQTKEPKDSTSGVSKLVSLHWTPLSGKELDNSLWRVNSMLEDNESQPETGDISKLIALFQKKSAQKTTKAKKEDDSPSNGKANLLDLTRANNVAISLQAFKDISFKELADVIAFLDPARRITGERTLFLRGLLPTLNEVKVIREYEGSDDRLIPAERWFRQVAGIQRIDEKVLVMQTMETFRSEADSLSKNFRLLAKVCNQVIDSEKLQILLGMVLRIGNIMNEGTRTGGAAGFKFDSLLRLTQTKSSDGKTTVLDFLVTVFVEKDQRGTLDLLSDFPECHTAGRMVIGDLLSSAKELKLALEKCRTELDLLRSEAGVGKDNSTLNLGSNKDSKPLFGNPNASVMAAILAHGQNASKSDVGPPVHRPSAPEQPTVSNQSLQPVDISSEDLKAGISRLRHFIIDSDNTFRALEVARKEALDACKEVSKYCGESGGTGATSTLLSILAEFAAKLDAAVRKYDEKEKAKSRRLRRKGDDSSTQCSDDATKHSSDAAKKQKESLVLMVNDLLKTANDRTKEDFKKGRVSSNPSSKLKAIYDRESTDVVFGSPNGGRRKTDIVSAICQQDESINQVEDQKTRIQFGDSAKNASVTEVVASNSDDIIRTSPSRGVDNARALFEDMISRSAPNKEGDNNANRPGEERLSLAASPPRASLPASIFPESSSATKLAFSPKDESNDPNPSRKSDSTLVPRDFSTTPGPGSNELAHVKGATASPGGSVHRKREMFEKIFQSPDRKPNSGIERSPHRSSRLVPSSPIMSPPKLKRASTPTELKKSDPLPAQDELLADEQDGKISDDGNDVLVLPSSLNDEPEQVALSKQEPIKEQKFASDSTQPSQSRDLISAQRTPEQTEKGDSDQARQNAALGSPSGKGTERPNLSSLSKQDGTISAENFEVQSLKETVAVNKRTSSIPRLSDARKARSKFEKLVQSSTPPSSMKKKTTSLPKRRVSSPLLEGNAIILDTSSSQNRLRSRSEERSSEPNRCPSPNLNHSNASSVRRSLSAESVRFSASSNEPIASTPPRSLADLARQKRLDRADSAATREALAEVSVANQNHALGHGKESPVLRKAREKREIKHDEKQAAIPPVSKGGSDGVGESTFAQLARKKREQKRISSASTTSESNA